MFDVWIPPRLKASIDDLDHVFRELFNGTADKPIKLKRHSYDDNKLQTFFLLLLFFDRLVNL